MKPSILSQRSRSRKLVHFERSTNKELTEQRLEWSIHFSYTSPRQWFEYLNLYFDLFTDEATAQLKARTHSVAMMCIILRNKYGCSLPRIYRALLREKSKSDMELHEDIINVKTKWDFIDSLYEL